MAEVRNLGLKLRFSGKDVDEHGLDLYDGATSFYGFAQAIQICVHAFLNKDVVSRAPALKRAHIYFSAPRRGSVLFDLVACIEKYPVTAALLAPAFYDFVKFAFSKAGGLSNVSPDTEYITKLNTDDEPFFDALAEQLEGPLQRGHRSIVEGGVKTITIERPRSELVKFNQRTADWVFTRDENPNVKTFTGNVTRYNSITGNGRAFIRELNRVVPIRPGAEFPESDKGFLTWSLHGNNVDTKKELKFEAKQIDSALGDVKRLILVNCEQTAEHSK